jgi:hypothetical protein
LSPLDHTKDTSLGVRNLGVDIKYGTYYLWIAIIVNVVAWDVLYVWVRWTRCICAGYFVATTIDASFLVCI